MLREFNYSLHNALNSQSNRPLQFGSEFKPYELIEPLLSNHPLWTFTSKVLSKGESYPLRVISSEDRTKDIAFFISRGNHKSTLDNESTIRKLLQEDVTKCFSLVLPIDTAKHLPGLSISPLGCQQQDTINENGEIIKKNRLTHINLSPVLQGILQIYGWNKTSYRHVIMATAYAGS